MAKATVMLAGASGVGKSTLGNYLLTGSPDKEFPVASGRYAVTTCCEAREDMSHLGSTFQVIDTPGTPPTSAGTDAYIKEIKRGAKKAGGLHALVFVIEYSLNLVYRLSDMEQHASLLKQFNKLGCNIIIACRVPGHLPGKNGEQIRNAEQSWNDFVNEVIHRAGLDDSVAIYFLEAADMASIARKMRSDVMGFRSQTLLSDSGMKRFGLSKRLCA